MGWDLRCFVCCHAPSTRHPAWCVCLVLNQWVLNESPLTASLAQGASRGRAQADVQTDLGSSPGPVTSLHSLVSHTAVVRIEDNTCQLSTQHLTVHTVVRFPLAQPPRFPCPPSPTGVSGEDGVPGGLSAFFLPFYVPSRGLDACEPLFTPPLASRLHIGFCQ